MLTTENSFEKAQLSLAAYSLDLQRGMFGSDDVGYRSSLELAGMSAKQAEIFSNTYEVVDQYTDPGTSGFSATLFKKVDEYFFAIRGTEGIFNQDFVEDVLSLASDGAAWRQIIEMYNYYQRLTATAGADVIQYRRNVIFDESQGIPEYETYTATGGGLGFLSSSEPLAVAGHSLGGHLAVAFGNLFPGITDSVSVYNGLGIERNLFTEELFSTLSGGLVTGLIDVRVTHLLGEAGPEIISNFFPVPGDNQLVFIEDQFTVADPPSARNHSVRALSDSLAVYNLLGTLDPTLELSQATPYLESASNVANKSLEAIVNAVGEIFGAGVDVAIDDRNALYTGIESIRTLLFNDPGIPNPILKPEYQNLQVVTPETLVASAELDTADGLAYRYALENLNPFAVTGGPALYSGQAELAAENFTAEYLEDRAIFLSVKNRLFTADATTLRLSSDRYFKDFEDATNPLVLRSTTSRSRTPQRFLFGSSRDDAGTDLLGESEDDRIYGRGGNDTLEGGGGNDYLEGGTGDDTYIYNAGDGVDTIFDADGVGSIEFRAGAGTTTLGGTLDSVQGAVNLYEDDNENRYAMTGDDLLITLKDGAGQIVVKKFTDGVLGISLNQDEVPQAPVAPAGVQFFALGQYVPNVSTRVSPATQSGDYDLEAYGVGPWDPFLTEVIFATGIEAPVFGRLGDVGGGLGDSYIQGDDQFNFLIDDLYSTQEFQKGESSPLDWLVGDPVWDPLFNFNTPYFGLAERVGNDVLRGGGGNDWLYSRGGDDWLYGEDGNDVLIDNPGLELGDDRWLALPGASSDDNLFGGAGDDFLATLQGKDYLNGGEGDDVLLSGKDDDTLSGGGGNDWLLADAGLTQNEFVLQPDFSYERLLTAAEEETEYGKDTLLGGGGNDVLAGGGDDDWLMGGSGNDTLWGDGDSALEADGSIQISAGDGTRDGNDTLLGEEGDDILLGGGGDDFLDGGQGNDQLAGDDDNLPDAVQGDDRLFGGDGDDILVGNGGNDFLSGDKGDDRLFGDEGEDDLFGGDGADVLIGGTGDDVLSGEAGNDQLIGGDGDDGLFGGAGADRFDGGDGDDVLSGGSGSDEIYGSAGDDILGGGSGLDIMLGGAGDDIYLIDTGSGQDTIVDTEGNNNIIFGGGITADGLSLFEIQGNDGAYYLGIEYGSSGDRVFIKNGPLGAVSSFTFADGSALSFSELMEQAGLPLTGVGSEGDDILQGGSGADVLLGGGGNDEVRGGGGADELIGGAGQDILNAESGDDVLNGGTGNDVLRGGVGSDSYFMQWGMGQDTLIEEGVENSVLQLDAGISLAELVMSRDGNDLVVRFNGVSDGVRIQDFALSSQVWEVRTDDGVSAVIDNSLIDSLETVVVDSAASAIERYEANVKSIFFSTRGEKGSVAGPDGVLRRTTSIATRFSATTEFFNEEFAIAEQVSDAGSVIRLSTPDYATTRLLVSQESVESAILNTGIGQTYFNTSGGVFNPLTGSGIALPPGAVIVNAFGRPQDATGDLSLDTGGYTQPIGYWSFPAGSDSQGLQFNTIQHSTYQRDSLLTLERITAGASDNTINTSGYSVVDAGAGNDTVVASYKLVSGYSEAYQTTPFRYDSLYDPRNVGVLLYGNTGDDTLTGGGAVSGNVKLTHLCN